MRLTDITKYCLGIFVCQCRLSRVTYCWQKRYLTFANNIPDLPSICRWINEFVDLIADKYDLVIRTGYLEDSSLIARYIFQFTLGDMCHTSVSGKVRKTKINRKIYYDITVLVTPMKAPEHLTGSSSEIVTCIPWKWAVTSLLITLLHYEELR